MPKARNIPFIDLSLKKTDLDKTISNISKLIKDKNFIGGNEVKNFQENLIDYEMYLVYKSKQKK